MKRNKTVSVVLCTYNGEKYIREQLESIIHQTYSVYELIIQDDCSTDRTPAICQTYAQTRDFIHFISNPQRLGFNENFRTAVLKATGDYIALSDQDDVWYPDKIGKQVAAIGSKDLCFCCHERGKDRRHTRYVTPQYTLEALLFNGFAGHTMLLAREFAQNPDNWLGYIHYDWSLAIQAQLHHGIVRIDQPLNWHRTHEGSAIDLEQKKFHKQFDRKLTYQPYWYGCRNYHALQQKDHWKALYRHILEATSQDFHPLAHRMCGLMLNPSPLALLELCWLCMRHRQEIYWNGNAKGWKGWIRSFFYPFIFAYNNVQYDL